MSHFIGNILLSTTYPFQPGAGDEPSSVIRDLHLFGVVSAACTGIRYSSDKEIFVTMVGQTAGGPVSLYGVSSPGLQAPLTDSEGVYYGWFLAADVVPPSIDWSGEALVSPLVIVPAYAPSGGAVGKQMEIVGAGGITVALSADSRTLRIGCLEEAYTAVLSPLLADISSGKDTGVLSVRGVSGKNIGLSVDQASVLALTDGEELAGVMIVPEFIVKEQQRDSVEDEWATVHSEQSKGSELSVVAGPGNQHRQRFTYEMTEGRILVVEDADVAIHGAKVTYTYDPLDTGIPVTVTGMEGTWLEVEPLGDGILRRVMLTQAWTGCDGGDVFVDRLICSSVDGSTQAYPLDGYACEDGAYCPPVWGEET